MGIQQAQRETFLAWLDECNDQDVETANALHMADMLARTTTVWVWDVVVAKCAEQLITLGGVEIRNAAALGEALARALSPFMLSVRVPEDGGTWTDPAALDPDWEPVRVWLCGGEDVALDLTDVRYRLLDDPDHAVRAAVVVPLEELDDATRAELLDPEGPYADDDGGDLDDVEPNA